MLLLRNFDDKILWAGLTYSATSCLLLQLAIEVLKIYEDENLIENAAIMAVISGKNGSVDKKHSSIGDFRNTGLLGCIELVKKTVKTKNRWRLSMRKPMK